MRDAIPYALLAMALMAAGCTSTTTIGGDASTDAAADTSADTGTDTAVDPPPDTAPDAPPDVVPDACLPPNPPPSGPTVGFTIDGSTDPGWIDINQGCHIVSLVGEDEGSLIITMDCHTVTGEFETHWIELYSWPDVYPPLWEGQVVRFRYVSMAPWWTSRWFRLSTPEGVEVTWLAGIDADEPNPPIYEVFFPPLGISVSADHCPLVLGDCFDTERVALAIRHSEWSTLVFDSTIGFVGDWEEYAIYVDVAALHHNFRCTDIPSGRFTALIFQSLWD